MYSAKGARYLSEVAKEKKERIAFYKISQSTHLRKIFELIDESVVKAVSEGRDSTSILLLEITEVMGGKLRSTSSLRSLLEDLGYEVGMTFSPDKIKISWSGK